MKIRALLFDFDETLLVNEESSRQSIRHAWELVQKEYYQIPPEKVVETYMDVRDKFWHVPDEVVIPIIQKGLSHVRRELWGRTFQSLEINRPELIPDLIKRFGAKRIETWKLYPEVMSVLHALRLSYKLVMVTNGVSEVQRAKLRKVDIEPWFRPILVSGEIGISKPDAKFFHRAADLAQVKYEECIVIGDSLRNDIAGSKNAGMISVWINRDGISLPPEYQPNYQIHTLRELPLLVSEIK